MGALFGLGYLAVANLAGFIMMFWDKRQAMLARWRTPEKTLLGIALIGGSLGVYAGMRLFRHKTKHTKFSLGVPLIMLLQAALMVYLFGSGDRTFGENLTALFGLSPAPDR